MNTRQTHDTLRSNQTNDTTWVELLQRAFDGYFPSEQKLEEFLDHWEKMP